MCASGFPASPSDLFTKITQGYTYHGSDRGNSFVNMCASQSNATAGYTCKPQRILDVCQPLFERMQLMHDWGLEEKVKSWDSEAPPSKNKWSTLTAYEKSVASRLLSLQGGFYTEEIWNKEIGGGMCALCV